MNDTPYSIWFDRDGLTIIFILTTGFCTSGVVVGHFLMRYMIKDSFGDAYRTTSVTSSLILGLAGSATLVIGIAVVVMSGSTLVSIYSQMRTGNGWRAETTPVRPLARRLRLDSTRRDLLEVIVGGSIPVMLGVYFSDVVGPFAGYIWADMEMLDGDHAMVGYILGQMIVYIVLLVAMQLNEANWWRRRLRGERERDVQELVDRYGRYFRE